MIFQSACYKFKCNEKNQVIFQLTLDDKFVEKICTMAGQLIEVEGY